MIIFYHNDLDGKCSAAIVHQAVPDAEMIPINYNLEFPFEKILKDDYVWIVDYSLPTDQMHWLLNITKNVTWIDHHRTALERFQDDAEVTGLPGIRDDAFAACELTWMYINPQKVIPPSVALIGDYDTWKFKLGRTRTLHFYLGMLAQNTDPANPLWGNLFDHWIEWIGRLISDGEVIERYRAEWGGEYIKSWSFPGTIEQYSVLFLNIGTMGSTIFGEKIKDYDIVSTFVIDGNRFVFSLYSEKVDVGRIAESFGGGGHKGAAGFEMSIHDGRALSFLRGS